MLINLALVALGAPVIIIKWPWGVRGFPPTRKDCGRKTESDRGPRTPNAPAHILSNLSSDPLGALLSEKRESESFESRDYTLLFERSLLLTTFIIMAFNIVYKSAGSFRCFAKLLANKSILRIISSFQRVRNRSSVLPLRVFLVKNREGV